MKDHNNDDPKNLGVELPMSHDPLFESENDDISGLDGHDNLFQEAMFDIDQYDQPAEHEFEDETDSRTLEEINVTTENVGDTRNKHALIIEACRRIAVAQDLPYVAALFGTHELRVAFLQSQLSRMPPPTPMQIEIIVNTYEPGDNPAGVMQSMDKAALYIERKAEAYRPSDELMEQARAIAKELKTGIPRYAVFNESRLKAWMREHAHDIE